MENRTLERLKREGVPVNENLPKISLKKIRSSKDIAIRINILAVFKAISEDVNSLNFFKELLRKQDLIEILSKKEKEVLENGIVSKQNEIDLSWYQESLFALCWCLGIIPKMGSVKKEANLNLVYNFIPPDVELNYFISNARVIEEQDLLEELEYYYGLHWAVRHPENWNFINKFNYKKYNLSIIRERRKALEWVVDKNVDWDDVSLDT